MYYICITNHKLKNKRYEKEFYKKEFYIYRYYDGSNFNDYNVFLFTLWC